MMHAGSVAPRRPPQLAGPALYALLLAAALPIGVAMAVTLQRYPPSLWLAVAAGASLIGTLALALAHHRAAVALGFALLGIVVVEPAPSDLVFFVVIAVALARGRFRLRRVPAPVVAIVGIFAVLNLISAVQVADPGRAAAFLGVTLYLVALGLWLPGYAVSTARARLVVRAYVFAAVASAALGLLAALGSLPAGELLVEDGRARALFKDPNVFGPFLVPAALILVEELLTPRLLSRSRPLKAILLAIVTLGVLLSYSRGAWLNLAVGAAVMAAVLSLRRGGARNALSFLAIVLGAAVVVAGTVVATGSADFLAERARPQTYDAQRFSGQAAGLEWAKQYPFGAGPGQYEIVNRISAHSTYVRVLAEQGLPGLSALLALLTFTLIAGLDNAVRGRGTYGIGSAALLAAWCGLLANSLFIDTLHWRHLWIVAALIWAGAMRESRPGVRSGA